jgi:hypothetical protein
LDELTAEIGIEIGDRMMTMAACAAPFQLKQFSLQAEGCEIVPAVKDPMDTRSGPAQEYCDFVTWALENIETPQGEAQDLSTVVFQLSRGMWEGFRVADVVLRYLEDGPYAGLYGFETFADKECKQIGIDIDPYTNNLLHLTSYTPGGSGLPGDPLALRSVVPGGYDFTVPVDRCLIWTYLPQANIFNTYGNWRQCYKHWFRLDNMMRFWAKALERWGAPTFLAKVDTTNPMMMADVQGYLEEIRQGAAPVIPKGVDVDLLTTQSTMFDAFRLSCEWDEGQIAKLILGNVLTTGTTGGTNTNALGKVHQGTEQTVCNFARRSIEKAFKRQVIHRCLKYNFAGYDPALCPSLSLGGEEEIDTYNMMQAFDLAIADGVVWKGARFIRERLGFPPMGPDEEKGIAEEQAAQQEAQQQMADARNSGRAQKQSDFSLRRNLAILTRAILARNAVDRQEAA